MEMITSKTHTFFSPKKILFGLNSIRELGVEAKALGGSKALIVTDPGVIGAGIIEFVKPFLESQGISYTVYDKVMSDPPTRVVEETVQWIREGDVDIVIGLGGGSSLDTAKGAAILAKNTGTILNYCGIDLVPKPGLPKILIPTTAGTGSEGTKVLIITNEREGMKRALYSNYALADVAIVDPMLTLSMPPTLTADTGMDALVHAIETFVAITATPFSDILTIEAIRLISKSLPMAYAKGECLEARYDMALGSLMAGLAFGSGGLGAVHALAYPLGTEYHLPHGRTNGMMLPHVMAFNLIGGTEKYGKIAEAMGARIEGLSQIKRARSALAEVRSLLEQINMPYQLKDYGIPKEDISKLAKEGMKYSRLFIPNPRDLSEEDVKRIYTEAW
jgi:alcohol dehydrogenase class IV